MFLSSLLNFNELQSFLRDGARQLMKKRIGNGCFAIVLLCCEVVFVIKMKGLCMGQTSLMSLKKITLSSLIMMT